MDRLILDWIQNNLQTAVWDAFFVAITRIGNYGMLWWLLAGILIACKRTRKIGIILLCALALDAIVVGGIIKPLIRRPRPFQTITHITLLISAPTGYSFPSAHASLGFTAASVCYYLNKRLWAILWGVVAGVIAFSRLYLYVHYPSDVISGGIIGIVIGFLTVKIFEKYHYSGKF